MLRSLNSDIGEMKKLRDGEESKLDAFNATVERNFFAENSFRIDSVNTKTFVLMLANKKPLSFVSGAPIDLEPVLRDHNRNEFHHLYPRAFLRSLENGAKKTDVRRELSREFLLHVSNRQHGLGWNRPERLSRKDAKQPHPRCDHGTRSLSVLPI